MMLWPFSRKGASGFSWASTADQVTAGVSASGLTAIVTGASSGIGAETARVLAARGAHVVMAARNLSAAETVRQAVLSECPSAAVDLMELDLSSLASVRKFATDFASMGLPLNILVNNAGIMATPFSLSKDGIEMQFATNHVGHFLLTHLLLETMKKTSRESNVEGRIVNVSSEGHRFAYKEGIRFAKLNDEEEYSTIAAYGQSKLANILHANELARRFKAEAGMHGMAGPISVRTSARHPLSVPQSSLIRSAHASQLAMRAADLLFPCAKLSKVRVVVAAATEFSKAPSSSGLANRQPSKEILEKWRSANAVCFDVDSTVCLDEGIDELADFCGAGQAVAEWTTKAMTGTVSFEEALAARISLIKPSLSQVEECLEKRPPRISPGIADLIKKLKANNTEVFLVSGGFRQMIKPVAFDLGIPTENIIANQLLFGKSGEYAGFDPTEPTSRSGGKAVAVQQIREDRGYNTLVMIGDGATDLEARQPGGADLFICYAGVQMREAVAEKADWTVFEFQELISELP